MDGEVSVSNEDVYNKMNKAMMKFSSELFNPLHVSHYTSNDIDILDEYRTVAPSGILETIDDEFIEIDMTKAYTSSFMKLGKIPVFNEIDY